MGHHTCQGGPLRYLPCDHCKRAMATTQHRRAKLCQQCWTELRRGTVRAPSTPDQVPPPGSDAAQRQGCLCPPDANNHGQGYRIEHGHPLYWINVGCRVHNPPPEPEDDDDIARLML